MYRDEKEERNSFFAAERAPRFESVGKPLATVFRTALGKGGCTQYNDFLVFGQKVLKVPRRWGARDSLARCSSSAIEKR